jgi:Flp pilus assembly pilin Flp
MQRKTNIPHTFFTRLDNENGATLLEYVIALMCITVVLMIGIASVGEKSTMRFCDMGVAIGTKSDDPLTAWERANYFSPSGRPSVDTGTEIECRMYRNSAAKYEVIFSHPKRFPYE